MKALQEVQSWLRRFGHKQKEEEKKQIQQEMAFFSEMTRRTIFNQPEINREAGRAIELLRARLEELREGEPAKQDQKIKQEYERVMR